MVPTVSLVPRSVDLVTDRHVGIGALSSPLVCQTLLAHGWQWERFYFISLGFTLLNCICLVFSFHSTTREFETDKQQSLDSVEPPKDIEDAKFDLDNPSPEPSLRQYNSMYLVILLSPPF